MQQELALFQVEACDIRHIYKRSYCGYIVYVDDEYIQGLAGGYLLMKILVHHFACVVFVLLLRRAF